MRRCPQKELKPAGLLKDMGPADTGRGGGGSPKTAGGSPPKNMTDAQQLSRTGLSCLGPVLRGWLWFVF